VHNIITKGSHYSLGCRGFSVKILSLAHLANIPFPSEDFAACAPAKIAGSPAWTLAFPVLLKNWRETEK